MPRALPTVTAFTATLMLCACTDAGGTPKAAVTTSSQSRTSVPRPAPAPIRRTIPKLRVPGRLPGEISRTVVTNSHNPQLHTITLRDARAGDRSYVVKAACTARRTTTALAYVLLDARASSASKSEAERTISSGTIPCDGTPIVDSAGPLGHGPVTVDFTAVPVGISQAYAVVVPG